MFDNPYPAIILALGEALRNLVRLLYLLFDRCATGGDGELMRFKALVASEWPSRLTHPDLDVLASVSRAIHI